MLEKASTKYWIKSYLEETAQYGVQFLNCNLYIWKYLWSGKQNHLEFYRGQQNGQNNSEKKETIIGEGKNEGLNRLILL